jgi:hypothetical protein
MSVDQQVNQTTHVLDVPSSELISPNPTTDDTRDIHITGRYLPDLVTTRPEIIANNEAPSEKGSILCASELLLRRYLRIQNDLPDTRPSR